MTDRPILFSAPMVRALIDGRKTQTRRVLKGVPEAPSDDSLVHPPKHEHAYFDAYCGGKRTDLNPRGMTNQWCWWTRDDRCGHGCKVPYVPGDRLWVKETWSHSGDGVFEISSARIAGFIHGKPIYRADPEPAYSHAKWWPSIFMPREFSRLTLIVTDVRVQRLNDCSEEDAIAEGCIWDAEKFGYWVPGVEHPNKDFPYLANATARGMYAALWDTINGSGAWLANPWVVAVSFTVERRNIDQVTQ